MQDLFVGRLEDVDAVSKLGLSLVVRRPFVAPDACLVVHQMSSGSAVGLQLRSIPTKSSLAVFLQSLYIYILCHN